MTLEDIKNVSKVLRIVIGITIIALLMTHGVLAASPWWDSSRHFRLPVTIGATGTERYEKPVDIGVNFTGLLNGVGQSGTLDVNSINVVEINSAGTILSPSVPFQFDKDPGFDAMTKASGTIVFIMNGTTLTSASRYYHIYFNVTGAPFSPIPVAPLVTITDNVMDEGQLSYKVNAVGSTYYFQKAAGGFSSWNDSSGNDWISYNSVAGSAGTYRGIPNAVYAQGIFHPGFTCCTSNIISQGPIKIKIRSISNDGKWESIWEFYPRYATMTMTKANGSYWMLYEGTPGGSLEPSTDFMYRSNGAQNLLNNSWFSDIVSNEWAYFSDPTIGRSLFVAHHEDDGLQDMYKPLSYPIGSAQMTVFGIGRLESPVSPLISSVPQHFTIGLMDGTGFTQNSKTVYSAYKDLTVTNSAVEEYGRNNPPPVPQDTQITFNGANDTQPSWSPDGQWISFASTRSGSWDVYKASKNGEGSGLARLTTYSGFDIEPSWNPNNRILFSSGPGQHYEDVWIMNNDGTNRQQLTSATDFDEYPDWSPDGTNITWSSVNGDANGSKQIWVMKTDGSNKHRLNTMAGIQPAWSPDGTRIAFKCYTNGYSICVMNADGTNLRVLISVTSNTHDPDWSPDSSQIVYASKKDGDYEIYVMNADGTNNRQLTSNTGIDDNFPSWSPDGQYIAFSSTRSGNEEIWVMSVNYGSMPTLSITSSLPTTNPTTIIASPQTFSIALNQNANVIWYVDGSIVKTDMIVSASSYTNSTAGIGVHSVNATATNGTSTVSRIWSWTVQDNVASVTVISPNGGESWINGTTNAIRWNYNGNPGSLVQIELLKGGVLDSTITPSASIGSGNVGSYDWPIPSTQTIGNDYKVRITSTVNPIYTDVSDNNFAINVATPTSVNLIMAIRQGSGNIEVFRNDSGTWTSLGQTATTKTYSVVQGSQLRIVATADPGYTFEKYMCCNGITITTNPLVVIQKYNGGLDAYFKAMATDSVVLTSPNGGENWVNNTIKTISWNYNGNPGSLVQIELLKNGILNSVIIPSTSIGSSGTGSYNWLIPSTQVPGTDYKVRITSTTNPTYTDTSSNNFTISAGAPATINLVMTIKQGFGNVEVFRNDSGTWTSLGQTTTTRTYTMVQGTQIKIIATADPGYVFEKWVTNTNYQMTVNPLIVTQNYNGGLDTYFRVA